MKVIIQFEFDSMEEATNFLAEKQVETVLPTEEDWGNWVRGILDELQKSKKISTRTYNAFLRYSGSTFGVYRWDTNLKERVFLPKIASRLMQKTAGETLKSIVDGNLVITNIGKVGIAELKCALEE